MVITTTGHRQAKLFCYPVIHPFGLGIMLWSVDLDPFESCFHHLPDLRRVQGVFTWTGEDVDTELDAGLKGDLWD